jgi:hypothetical protein
MASMNAAAPPGLVVRASQTSAKQYTHGIFLARG